MGRPEFYSKVPRDVKEQKDPNIIYTTKGLVFIHIFKTRDMERIEYFAITPELTKKGIEKRDMILDRMYERAHLKTGIKTQDDLKKAIREAIDKITVIDKKSKGKIEKSKGGKIKVTPAEKMSIEYNIIKEIVGGGPLEPFMRDPYIEDIHILTGENVHLIHKVFDMVATNIKIEKHGLIDFHKNLLKKLVVLLVKDNQ